jgi:hypothetical protein
MLVRLSFLVRGGGGCRLGVRVALALAVVGSVGDGEIRGGRSRLKSILVLLYGHAPVLHCSVLRLLLFLLALRHRCRRPPPSPV